MLTLDTVLYMVSKTDAAYTKTTLEGLMNAMKGGLCLRHYVVTQDLDEAKLHETKYKAIVAVTTALLDLPPAAVVEVKDFVLDKLLPHGVIAATKTLDDRLA